MEAIKFFIIIFLTCLLTSCVVNRIYFNDTKNIDDGEIWGSSLYLFFANDSNILITKSKSLKFGRKLQEVKQVVSNTGDTLQRVPIYYDYAFITSRSDTLFYSTVFQTWRYKNRKKKVDFIIEDYLKRYY